MDKKTLEQLVKVVPSKRQIDWQQTEFYAFIHFTINTYVDKDLGDGNENPQIFNPEKLDVNQWVDSVKSAGMKGIVLTCKHHDGFCLWPSDYTEHCIKNTPYKNGNGDIVKELSEACKKAQLKFGVYLSPWDRNSRIYGSDAYNDYFVNQLTELLTNYGELFSVWFDGHCVEKIKVQPYDWERIYKLIRHLQPNAAITICGPDARWCGNEAGEGRQSEWSVVPKRLTIVEPLSNLKDKSHEVGENGVRVRSTNKDLGSREVLEGETEFAWYPCEVDTSVRPSWFYHTYEDDKVRSLDDLLNVYYNSVGANSTLILNIPPNTDGLFHENDVKRLGELGDYLNNVFSDNIISDADITCDNIEDNNVGENIKTDTYDTYFKTIDGVENCQIIINFNDEKEFDHLVLKENIELSQRIEEFNIDCLVDGEFKTVYNGTAVGYKKIAKFAPVKTKTVKINISKSRISPTLSFVGIYNSHK